MLARAVGPTLTKHVHAVCLDPLWAPRSLGVVGHLTMAVLRGSFCAVRSARPQLLEPMFATGLSEPLINALVDLAVHIRALLPPIQGARQRRRRPLPRLCRGR